MRRHRTRVLAASTALLVVVAACGGTDEPSEPPSPAAEATAAVVTPAPATPAPTPPPSPTAVPEPTAVATASTPPATPALTDPPATSAPPESGSAASSTFGEPEPAPELADLVLPDGSTFDLADLQGQPVLIYFGYTHCPDVCPATLGELFGVFEALPQTQALFVSVDPERDTPEFLEEWTLYLPDNLYAVTGSPGAIRRAADNYGVKYARVETTSTAGYTMSHTADLYLIDADGRYLLAYPFGTPAAEIVEDLEMLNAS